jgi:hypothetical protein
LIYRDAELKVDAHRVAVRVSKVALSVNVGKFKQILSVSTQVVALNSTCNDQDVTASREDFRHGLNPSPSGAAAFCPLPPPTKSSTHVVL